MMYNIIVDKHNLDHSEIKIEKIKGQFFYLSLDCDSEYNDVYGLT